MCLAQGHNAVLKTATPRSEAKYATTEPLLSYNFGAILWMFGDFKKKEEGIKLGPDSREK